MASDAGGWVQIEPERLDAALRAPLDAVRQRIVALNPGHDHRMLLATPAWDLHSYNRLNRPALVGALPEGARPAFSAQRGDRVQDLAFAMPGQGWRLPALLSPYLEAIAIAVEAERALNADFAANPDAYHACSCVAWPRRRRRPCSCGG